MNKAILETILSGPSQLNKDGYPILAEESFQLFRERIPHLFKDGYHLLEYLHSLALASPQDGQNPALKVLQTVTRTAAVTAPSDLWIFRHLLSTYQELGIFAYMQKKSNFTFEELVKDFNLDPRQLRIDLEFFCSRCYLDEITAGSTYRLSSLPQVHETLAESQPLAEKYKSEFYSHFLRFSLLDVEEVSNFLYFPAQPSQRRVGWPPTLFEIEAGFRLVPLILALRVRGEKELLKIRPIETFLEDLGLRHKNSWTPLGERTITKGPGPMGIIHAYHPYMANHKTLLQGQEHQNWVARSENVAASRDANSLTFSKANDSLDQFCRDYQFSYKVFIEHAVGHGEATRQRYERSGSQLLYFGADLEDAAIAAAEEEVALGRLPQNMQFIRHADIGQPDILLRGLKDADASPEGAVMLVGNGFHEVRNQSNESMTAIFKAYQDAGIILVFTEETGLMNEDLIATAWNTYHAGFRYVHALSGQGLRPAMERPGQGESRFSWKKCATEGGYLVLDKYCYRTRKIYPHPKEDGYNPAISVTYFCVPQRIAKVLNI